MTHCCLGSRGLIETYLSLKIANMEKNQTTVQMDALLNICTHFDELLTQKVVVFVIILS